MSEPANCPDLEEADQPSAEMEWKWQQLKDIHELASDLIGVDADESTTRIADRCGLGKEFRQYLTTLT